MKQPNNKYYVISFLHNINQIKMARWLVTICLNSFCDELLLLVVLPIDG